MLTTVKGKGDYFWIWGSDVLNLDFLTILCTHTHTHTHTHTPFFVFTAACGILAPQPGIELMLSAVEAQSVTTGLPGKYLYSLQG